MAFKFFVPFPVSYLLPMLDAWETRQLLFVYGSLLLKVGEPLVDEALAKAQGLGLGHIHGRLFDLGDYPGAKYAAPGSAKHPPLVQGRLLGIPDPDPFFRVLDLYEGFDRVKPLESEFVRSTTSVILAEGGRVIQSQVYFYNRPTSGKRPVSSGDWLAVLHARAPRKGPVRRPPFTPSADASGPG